MRCTECAAIDRKFDLRIVQSELERYHRSGPDPTTAVILERLGFYDLAGMTLLDVGGGVGVVMHELFERGLGKAIQVEAASVYQDVARQEVERRSTSDRVEFLFGDFVDLADRIEPADLVTLDRVICCYSDYERLTSAAVARSRRVLAVGYPRYVWYTRLVVRLRNVARRLLGDDFRSYVHPVASIEKLIMSEGFERASVAETTVWRVAIFERS